MKKIFKKFICTLLIFSVLASYPMAAFNYTPEFSDELSRVGIRLEPEDSVGLDMLSSSGVNTIRYALNWHKFEPSKGVWDTDYIDSRVSLLKNYNFSSMIGIGVNNQLYSGNSDIRYGVETRANLEAFSDYCLKLGEYLTKNYPQITTFLIWNEPNSTSFWKDDPNPSSYYNLVKVASIAFKKAIPDCTIIAGIAANPSLQFLSQLYSLGIYKYADVISAQPYVAPSNADAGILEYRFYQYDKLNNQFGGWKENYISEIGWHTYDTDNTIGVSEESQATNIIKSLALADAYDMSGVNIYELIDGTGNTVTSENHFGLVGSDYTTKKGFDALVCYQDIIGGAEYAGKLVSSDNSSTAYIYHKNGKIIAIAWSQNDSAPLSTLNIGTYNSALNMYGATIVSPSLSQSPIYLELSDKSLLYSAINKSIQEYYENIPDECLTAGINSLKKTNILSMNKDTVRNYFEQNYTEAFNLINQYSENNESINLSLYLASSYALHKAAEKIGILCNYLSNSKTALSELASDAVITSAQKQVKSPNSTASFDMSLSGIELGDTVTITVTNFQGLPIYVNQKTFGSDVEPTLDFTLDALDPGQYNGHISSRISNPVINSITASSPYVQTVFEKQSFTITVEDSLNPELRDFAHQYPYAQAILHQAERYNARAHILNESAYESDHKTSYIEVADYISAKLSELSVKVATIEEADFDKGFSIITTPSILKNGGTVEVYAEITNKNATAFDGQVKIVDNKNNILYAINKVIPGNATETIKFSVTVPERADTGQYFYYINLVKSETCLSSKAIYINTQIGPYSSAEITDENQIATTPSENKFKIGDKEYILLDTTSDDESKFFVMEESVSATKYFDTKRYDIAFDPSDYSNIAYYLNNNYPIDSTIKEYINANHLWLTEAGHGDSVCPTDYTVKCGVNLMSVEEWYRYAGKFGYVPSNNISAAWWLRTPGTNIDTIRYISTLSGKCLHTYTDNENRDIRPVFYLNHDFFKKVKPDSMGSNVIDAIKQSYSAADLIVGGSYTKNDLITLGIATEDDIILAEVELTDTEGNLLLSPENQQNLSVKVNSNSDDPFTGYFAIYDSQNKLISCDSSDIKNNTIMNITLPKKVPEGAFAKFFMWKVNTLIPLDIPILFKSINIE